MSSMSPAKMALYAVIIRSLRSIANALERWLQEQKVDEAPH